MTLKKLDDFIINFSRYIVALKHFEQSSDAFNSPSHKATFKKLLDILMKRRQFALDQELWRELYLRSLCFYKFQTTLCSIPMVLVTKHNHIIPFYMQQQIHKVPNTLFHADCHLDQNPIKHSAMLPRLYDRYLETQDTKYVQEAQETIWDIGASNSGVLFTTGLRDFVWGIPSWLPDSQLNVDIYIKQNKNSNSLVSTTDISKEPNCEEFSINVNSRRKDTKEFAKIQTGKLKKDAFKSLVKIIKKNGNEYILDIDLDYIICNGKPYDKTYWKETYDVSSTHRLPYLDFNQDIPRSRDEKSDKMLKYEKALKFEMKEVDKRIRDFLKMLALLKRKGLTPSHISVCDSTNIMFQECAEINSACNSVSNNYVPQHTALYVHTKIMKGLHNLFCAHK